MIKQGLWGLGVVGVAGEVEWLITIISGEKIKFAKIESEVFMSDSKHLYVLWTNDNPITAEKMVFMYTINSLIHGWWEKVTLIVWGATTKLVNENANI